MLKGELLAHRKRYLLFRQMNLTCLTWIQNLSILEDFHLCRNRTELRTSGRKRCVHLEVLQQEYYTTMKMTNYSYGAQMSFISQLLSLNPVSGQHNFWEQWWAKYGSACLAFVSSSNPKICVRRVAKQFTDPFKGHTHVISSSTILNFLMLIHVPLLKNFIAN